MTDPALERAKSRLLEEIRFDAEATASWTGRARFSDAVMRAMARVPREEFVLPADRRAAYVNRPLPIGHGQTISQPYIVALMTDLLNLSSDSRVLEIGTGCGYQAAVLAEVAGQVFSVERVAELAEPAAVRLKDLGYDNVRVRAGDGYLGWEEEAPFDGIMVTAAPEYVPPALTEQLKTGGRLVIPVGPRWGAQALYVVDRLVDGELKKQRTIGCAFVPLVEEAKN